MLVTVPRGALWYWSYVYYLSKYYELLDTVLQLLKLPDGTVKVLVEGEQRGSIERVLEVDEHCRAEVLLIEEGETAEPQGAAQQAAAASGKGGLHTAALILEHNGVPLPAGVQLGGAARRHRSAWLAVPGATRFPTPPQP